MLWTEIIVNLNYGNLLNWFGFFSVNSNRKLDCDVLRAFPYRSCSVISNFCLSSCLVLFSLFLLTITQVGLRSPGLNFAQPNALRKALSSYFNQLSLNIFWSYWTCCMSTLRAGFMFGALIYSGCLGSVEVFCSGARKHPVSLDTRVSVLERGNYVLWEDVPLCPTF